MIKFLL